MWGDGEEREGYKEGQDLDLDLDLELFFMPVFEFLCSFVNMLLGRSDAR